MKELPKVSVLMPVYNAALFLDESISAVLTQTYKNFEFIIVNDGSTDSSKEKILKYDDPRIVYLELSYNQGIVDALNLGLSKAKGKYIVRTDADDKPLPHMIERLIDFLENHEDYVACGAFMKSMQTGAILSYPTEDEELKIYTLGACPFSHSVVTFRTQVLKDYQLKYNKMYLDGEDHGLWTELLPLGKFKNLPDVLVMYRESESQITNQKKYKENYITARHSIFQRQAFLYFALNQIDAVHYSKLITSQVVNEDELELIGRLIISIVKKRHLFSSKKSRRFFAIKWFGLCLHADVKSVRAACVYLRYVIKFDTRIMNLYHTVLLLFKKNEIFRSKKYWENRYQIGKNSGAGSYNHLAQFKADTINQWTVEKGINSFIEFGCGDGNQLSLLNIPNYIGLDVSPTAIKLCIARFKEDQTKSFFLFDQDCFLDNGGRMVCDCSLSLDVLYHLVEEDVYWKYLDILFSSAKKFVVIYAANLTLPQMTSHELYREFTKDISVRYPQWRLEEIKKNKYPAINYEDQEGSLADFFLFSKKSL
ncbi:MAG: glycosyltransferase [Bacteroidetes bacterium]|nr:glycosyltransferase [Bacteroidota bacterium]MBS1539738.1 glycosyltransferase [Bacteroidota bacterium]